VDTFCADTGVGWLTTEFELSLFAVGGALGTGRCTLMTGVARDTHPCKSVCTLKDKYMNSHKCVRGIKREGP
jgi:hypothetical protein